MELTATGLGTGLDVQGIVEQLVAAERQPTANRLNLQEARTNAELSALGKFKSALSGFQDTVDALSELSSFQKRITGVEDDTIFTASADSAAVPGSYEVQVKSLASRHKLASRAYLDAATAVGTGNLSITVNGQTAAITISAEANTLADIRDAINDAPDNPGVLATIVNADDGAHLVLSSRDTGANQTITITPTGGDGGLADLSYDPAAGSNPLSEIEAAADALVDIDGFAIASENNSISGAIEGVTIDLIDALPGTKLTLTVELDEPSANAAVGSFINAYNELIGTIAEVTSFNTDTFEAGPLLGDSAVRGIKDSLRRELSNAVDIPGVNFRTLADIGITTQPDGKLELDETKLSDAITANFDGVGEMFASESGVAVRIAAILESALSSTGQIENREETLQERLDRIGDQREVLDERMERVRSRLLDQFNAMDRLVSQLQNTSSFLSQQLAGF
jgi:flagellar hook-associated protein 2